MRAVNIVFDGPPGAESGRFVEAEDLNGRSVSIGRWIRGSNGYWQLQIPLVDTNLEVRLQAAADRLDATAEALAGQRAGPAEQARIKGKAEGVRLALSYLREGL